MVFVFFAFAYRRFMPFRSAILTSAETADPQYKAKEFYIMKFKTIIISLTLAVVLSVSAFAANAIADTSTEESKETIESSVQTERHRPHHNKEKVEEPENAIGKDAAKEAALKAAGVTTEETGKVRSHVSKTDDGTVVYKVHFSAGEKWYSYKIDALTGEVIEHSEQSAEEHEAAKEKARSENGETSEGSGHSGRRHSKRMRPDASESAEGESAKKDPSRAHGNDSDSTADTTAQPNTSATEQTIETI